MCEPSSDETGEHFCPGKPGLPEDPEERAMFDQFCRRLGGPLRAVASGLSAASAMAPQQGSYAKMLAIYANEVAKAADALGEPPL